MIYRPSDDSFLLASIAKEKAAGEVLEMGTGSGYLITAILSEKNPKVKKITGIDISPEAIKHCKKSITSKKTEFLQSDLFNKIKDKHISYDTIFFNPPYLPEDKREPADSSLTTTGGKHGYELILRFIGQLNLFLKPDGRCYLLFSSLSKKEIIDTYLRSMLFKFTQLKEKNLFFEKLYVYEITKTDLLKRISRLGLTEIHYLAKGKRGYIHTGIFKKKKVAIKTKNPSSSVDTAIVREAQSLKKVNKLGIGPKLITSTKDYVMYMFIEGDIIIERFPGLKKEETMKMIKDLLTQMKVLDDNNLQKEEMHHPWKHIILTKTNKPILIDFERLRYSQKPQNITQFCQFISSKRVISILEKKKIKVDDKKILSIAKEYSKNRDKDIIKKIMGCLE